MPPPSTWSSPPTPPIPFPAPSLPHPLPPSLRCFTVLYLLHCDDADDDVIIDIIISTIFFGPTV